MDNTTQGKRPSELKAEHTSASKKPRTDSERVCAKCKVAKCPSEFSSRQKKKKGAAKCRSCIINIEEEGAKDNNSGSNCRPVKGLHKCSSCHRPKHSAKSFAREEIDKGPLAQCHQCVEERQAKEKLNTLKRCGLCYQKVKLSDFPKGKSGLLCMECWHEKQIPFEKCVRCKEEFNFFMDSGSLKRERKRKFQGRLICCDCEKMEEREREEAREREKKREQRRKEKEEKDATPRNCAQCHQEKYKDSFSYLQWEEAVVDDKSICLECMPPEKELEYRKEQAWKMAKKSVIKKGKRGAVFYDYPLPKIHFGSCLGAEQPADLEGKYSIVFCHAYGLGQLESRTTRGSFTLTKSEDDGQGVRFKGRLEFDGSLRKSSMVIADCNCTIQDSESFVSGRGERHWTMQFSDLPLESFEENDRSVINQFQDRYANLHVLKNRIAMPWRAAEGESSDLLDDKEVHFKTLDEADAIARQDRELSSLEPTWIASAHPGISQDIAHHIHQFAKVTWKPDPVLFLEPGDLVLTLFWDNHPHFGVATELILRKSF